MPEILLPPPSASPTDVQSLRDLRVARSDARSAAQLAELERLLSLCEVQAIRSGVPLPLGRTRGAMASTLRSSAGTPAVSASTSSIAPRMPCPSAVSSSTRPGTRPVISGMCGWRESGLASSTGFASPDHTRLMRGTASIRRSCWWTPTRLRSCPSRAATFTRRLAMIRPRPSKDLSFSEVDNAAAAPKCLITHADFDWQGDQPLRHPWASTVIYELHVRGYTIHPSADVRCPGTFRSLIQKIPYLKDLGVTAVELMPVQEFNESALLRVNPHTGERLKNYWGYDPLFSLPPKHRTPASARTARTCWSLRRWSGPSTGRVLR